MRFLAITTSGLFVSAKEIARSRVQGSSPAASPAESNKTKQIHANPANPFPPNEFAESWGKPFLRPCEQNSVFKRLPLTHPTTELTRTSRWITWSNRALHPLRRLGYRRRVYAVSFPVGRSW